MAGDEEDDVRRVVPVLVTMALAGVACADRTPASPPDPVEDTGEDPLVDEPADDAPPEGVADDPPRPDDEAPLDPDGPLAIAVEAAVADAADAAGVDRADAEVVEVEEVTWPDGALGCPEPGELYTQALVEGYRIVVAVAGDEVTYHGARDGQPFRCDDPQRPVRDR